MRIFDVLREWNGAYVMVQVDDSAVGDDGRPRLLLGRALALDDGLQLHCPGWVEVVPLIRTN